MMRGPMKNNIYCSAPEQEWGNLPTADKYSVCSSHEDIRLFNASFKDVMLSVAKNVETSEYVHVSESSPVNTKFCCPYCSSLVTKVAGSIRRHHYRHAEGSDCPATPETLLHEGAKYYLQHALTKGIDIDFLVDSALLKRSKISELLSSMSIDSISVRASSIYSQPRATHNIEENFKNVRPDVLSYVMEFEKELLFAWEIFVSHEVDENKSELFREYNIPFIELSPIENGKSGYIFRVKSYGGFELLYGDYYLNNLVKDDYLQELVGRYSKTLDLAVFNSRIEKDRVNWRLEAQENAAQDAIRIISDKINNIGISDLLLLQNTFSTVIYPITSASPLLMPDNLSLNEAIRSDKNNWIGIKECDFRKHNEVSYIFVKTTNDKECYFLTAIGMLRGIYEKLASMKMLTGLLSVNDKTGEEILVGVKLHLPQSTSTKLMELDCLLYKYRNANTREIEVAETISKKSKTSGKFNMYVNSYCVANSFFVDSYDYQLKNIIYRLLRLFTLEAHLGTNAENKPRIDAIRINNLCDTDMAKNLLMNRLVDKSYIPDRFFR